jgi:hypothetical protein
MGMTLLLHIVAGTLGLAAGFVALYSAKGAPLHRKAGIVFFSAMLTTSVLGLTIAIVRGVAPAINVPAGLMTACLVITALTTVRPPSALTRWLDRGAMLVALGVGMTCVTLAFQAIAGTRDRMALVPFVMFGLIGMLAGIGDVRVMRSGALQGPRRLARHLWRMCIALFIASLSFFIGQADILPKAMRIYPLLAMPMLLVLITMFYFLWRVRIRRSLRGIVRVNAPETA